MKQMVTEQMKLLMDYTIFHIGLYTTLSTALIALLGLFPNRANVMKWQLVFTLICLVLAGIFGGLVASHIPHFKDFDDFYNRLWIGPWGFQWIPAWLAMSLEHIFFWLGVVFALWGAGKAIRGNT
jgi:uncharacterized membrane protein